MSLKRARGPDGRPIVAAGLVSAADDPVDDRAAAASMASALPPTSENAATHTEVWRIEFPWGAETLTVGQALTIGRDMPGHESHLIAYPNVSRMHAVFTATPDGVVVTDLASTNGTFLNDVQIGSRQSAVARDADVVRLAADLYSTVRRGASGVAS